MAIQQTKKQSDLEKRLALLRRQVYGRLEEFPEKPPVQKTSLQYPDAPKTSTSTNADITYLRGDLLKIASFSTLAISAQIVLFFILKNNILKLNFF